MSTTEPVVIPAPRAEPDLSAKPQHYWEVPCGEDGEHLLLVIQVLTRYDARLRQSYRALCGREVWPAIPLPPGRDSRCADCARVLEAMSPQPRYAGNAWALMRALDHGLSRRRDSKRTGDG